MEDAAIGTEPVVDRTHSQDIEPVDNRLKSYDARRLTYSTTFTNPFQRQLIWWMEWLTGKPRLLKMIRQVDTLPFGQGFFKVALDAMGIDIVTPEEQITRIPEKGPLVVVANHPHGFVDGMVIAEIVGRRRDDYLILTRSLLTEVTEISQFMIPVPFQHDPDALEKNLAMRRRAMEHLQGGGCVVLFPAGLVATSRTFFGPAIEGEWNPFTAKLITRSKAEVVPIHFPGQNSRLYQMANLISATLRQGLLIHEVVHALNKPQSPVVGDPLGHDVIQGWSSNPRGFVAWLREQTMELGQER